MDTKASCPKIRNLIASLVVIVGTSAAFAAEPPSTGHHAAPSKEMREKMATLHEEIAACLRSDKPIADCHSQAMKHCQDMMGKQGCPMMGMGHGGMHDHMMHDGQPAKGDEQEHK